MLGFLGWSNKLMKTAFTLIADVTFVRSETKNQIWNSRFATKKWKTNIVFTVRQCAQPSYARQMCWDDRSFVRTVGTAVDIDPVDASPYDTLKIIIIEMEMGFVCLRPLSA